MNDNPHVPVNQNEPQEEDEYEVLPILAEQDEPLQAVDNEALPPPAAQEPPRRGAPPAAYEPPRGAPTQEEYEPPRGAPTQAAYEQPRGVPAQEEYEPPPPPVRSRPPRPGRRSRGKLVLVGLAGLVVIAVLFSMFNQSFKPGAVITRISGSHHQSTPTQSTPTPASTPLPTTTPTVPSSVTSKELILLNPSMVRQGSSMGVTGTGFDARATVDVSYKQRQSDPGQLLNVVHADKHGTFYDNLTVPNSLSSGTFFIEARERGSTTKVALAAGVVAGGAPQLKLSAQVGKPGDLITATLHGFSPGEPIKVYWNTMSGQPVATLQADGGGSIGQAPVQVPFGAAGINTFLFVGARSQSLVAATFYLLSLYPSVKLSSYAIRADSQLNFSGVGFGPSERVLVYMNSDAGQPIAVIQTTQHGTFTNAPGFVIPFALKGRQTLIFLGEESRATVSVRWTVQPYMPNAQASTYGGLPGTTISFYASGFARQEIVHVYVGGGLGGGGALVSCFNTDDKGNAAAAGSYVIPGNAQGKVTFALIGSKSGGKATATLTVSAAPSPVQVPPQPPFTCPLDGATK